MAMVKLGHGRWKRTASHAPVSAVQGLTRVSHNPCSESGRPWPSISTQPPASAAKDHPLGATVYMQLVFPRWMGRRIKTVRLAGKAA